MTVLWNHDCTLKTILSLISADHDIVNSLYIQVLTY